MLIWIKSLKHRTLWLWASFAGTVFFLMALLVGWSDVGPIQTLSLIGTSMILEAQPAAIASIPLGFSPLGGTLVSLLANLILVPVLFLSLRHVNRWKWVARRLEKAQRWTAKYLRHGVWVLIPLAPFLGAYMCIALGFGLRLRLPIVLVCTLTGMVISTFFLTYGGHWVVQLAHGATWFRQHVGHHHHTG